MVKLLIKGGSMGNFFLLWWYFIKGKYKGAVDYGDVNKMDNTELICQDCNKIIDLPTANYSMNVTESFLCIECMQLKEKKSIVFKGKLNIAIFVIFLIADFFLVKIDAYSRIRFFLIIIMVIGYVSWLARYVKTQS